MAGVYLISPGGHKTGTFQDNAGQTVQMRKLPLGQELTQGSRHRPLKQLTLVASPAPQGADLETPELAPHGMCGALQPQALTSSCWFG